MHAMDISLTALNVEWRRLEVIAENLANANTAGKVGSPLYRELTLVSGARNSFSSMLEGGVDIDALQGVEVKGIEAGNAPPRLAHEPGSPLANKEGFVAYPAIDHALQMTKLVETSRNYEANLVAMNIAREMYGKALQLGGTS
jgi:flagellar basal-body rod protein FlgC